MARKTTGELDVKLDALHERITQGFEEINKRLDKLNGKVYENSKFVSAQRVYNVVFWTVIAFLAAWLLKLTLGGL